MSCNGCRVLRKGCSDTCVLRHCLRCISSPEAQAHATLFVTKFFGRAGLTGFINGVPESQRPALFQSLLYEACGRAVNPVYGAVGLLFSGKWAVCQTAVETVLKGGFPRPAADFGALQSAAAPVQPSEPVVNAECQPAGSLSTIQSFSHRASSMPDLPSNYGFCMQPRPSLLVTDQSFVTSTCSPKSTSTYDHHHNCLANCTTCIRLSDVDHQTIHRPFTHIKEKTRYLDQREFADDETNKVSMAKRPRSSSFLSDSDKSHKATQVTRLQPSIQSCVGAYKSSYLSSHSTCSVLKAQLPAQPIVQILSRKDESTQEGENSQYVPNVISPLARRVQSTRLTGCSGGLKGGSCTMSGSSKLASISEDYDQNRVQNSGKKQVTISPNNVIGEPDKLDLSLTSCPTTLCHHQRDLNGLRETGFLHLSDVVQEQTEPARMPSPVDSEGSVNTTVHGGSKFAALSDQSCCFDMSQSTNNGVKLLNLLQ